MLQNTYPSFWGFSEGAKPFLIQLGSKLLYIRPNFFSYPFFIVFWYILLDNCILIRLFWVLYENLGMRRLSIACWAYAETISSLTESTLTEFSCMLTAQPAFKFWQFLHGILKHAAEPTRKRFHCLLSLPETISSLAGHKRKQFYLWLSQNENGFIVDWVKGEIFQELTLQDWLKALTASSQPVCDRI
jgi:hypothetical protein